jgi:hypothetical protein
VEEHACPLAIADDGVGLPGVAVCSISSRYDIFKICYLDWYELLGNALLTLRGDTVVSGKGRGSNI